MQDAYFDGLFTLTESGRNRAAAKRDSTAALQEMSTIHSSLQGG